MESTDLPAVQVTPRIRYGVHGGNDTLKKIVSKLAKGDVSGAVWEWASPERLEPEDGNTLRALKEKHPLEEEVRKGIMFFHAVASGGPGWPPPWPPSFVGGPWFGGCRIAPFSRINRPGQRFDEW